MYKNTYIYNIKVVSDKAAYEKVGEYKVEIVEENGIRTVKSTVVINGTELESNQVLYNSESLLPIKSQVFTKFGDMDINIECHYKKGAVALNKKRAAALFL
ncbi:hemoblobin-interacting domain-containing protein [Clostridium thermarum]|uniref:hemoblobin-interacting domain-containing protein n=1 Tax=Clostridium thermarum TaxID=1716543 RepID=UPI0013D34BE1|nr:hemoblobin-interacting domain-containing protein [Clostridium thermarum]